jgi:glyoxylase-like metal-dependent hydrolase (beta-lactamase superfamily II)
MMHGIVTTVSRSMVKVHTYTAPESGWVVNSHIIELPTQLVLVDAQYTLANARAVAGHAATLGKPITRLYVTHCHPDHILGAQVFDVPRFALASVKARIAGMGDRMAAQEHARLGNAVPTRATIPDRVVVPGTEIIDGVHFEFRVLENAESEDALALALPEEDVIIAQDLLSNRVHLFLGEQRFDGWAAALEEYEKLPYRTVLAGHGLPGGKELYNATLSYLAAAESALAGAADGEDLKLRLIRKFPDYDGIVILDRQKAALFETSDA